jgi:hypothetical protein
VGKQRVPLAAHVALARDHVGTPSDSDDADVVEQQAVDLHGGDLPGREADDEQPAVLLEAAQRVGEAVASDRVDHDVHAT